jgi:hypothetical protein
VGFTMCARAGGVTEETSLCCGGVEKHRFTLNLKDRGQVQSS